MAAPKGNQFAKGLTNSGKPPIYSSPEDMELKINDFFDSLIDEKQEYKKRPTITGLALYLGFDSRSTFYEYKKNIEYSYMLKRASLVIEMSYEEMLLSKTCTGSIFALKNMGWKDSQEIEVKEDEKLPIDINITITDEKGQG